MGHSEQQPSPRDKTPTPPVEACHTPSLDIPKSTLHKGRLATFRASLRTSRSRPLRGRPSVWRISRRGRFARAAGARSAETAEGRWRGDRRRSDRLGRNTGRFWSVLSCLAPLAAIESPSKRLPARKPLVHEGMELRTVVVDISTGRKHTAQAAAMGRAKCVYSWTTTYSTRSRGARASSAL